MNKNITIVGRFTGARGGAISYNLMTGTGIVKSGQAFDDFSTIVSLPAGGNYTLILGGFTQGTFTIDIQGCTAANMALPKSYPANQNFNDFIQFTA